MHVFSQPWVKVIHFFPHWFLHWSTAKCIVWMASVLISSSTCLVVLFISTKIPTDVKRTDHESCHEYRQVSGCLEIKVLPTETLVSWVSNSPTLYLFANMRHGPLHAAVKHTTAIPSLFSFTNPSKSAYWNNVKNRMNLIIHIIRWKCNKEMIRETHHEEQQLSVERSSDKRICIIVFNFKKWS